MPVGDIDPRLSGRATIPPATGRPPPAAAPAIQMQSEPRATSGTWSPPDAASARGCACIRALGTTVPTKPAPSRRAGRGRGIERRGPPAGHVPPRATVPSDAPHRVRAGANSSCPATVQAMTEAAPVRGPKSTPPAAHPKNLSKPESAASRGKCPSRRGAFHRLPRRPAG